MKEEIFLQILFETKVNAIRHHSKEETLEAVQKIKTAIKQHRFEIVDRDKNLDFLHDEHLSKETACQLIDMFIEPKNLIAILPNRNKEGGELYLFSIVVPIKERKKYIYLKVEITSYGKVICISMHGQNEMMHVDYRKATDSPDNYVLQKMAKIWMNTYNKFGVVKIKDFQVENDDVTFYFEEPISEDQDIAKDIARAVPKDFGYRFKDIINNISFDDESVTIYLPFGKF